MEDFEPVWYRTDDGLSACRLHPHVEPWGPLQLCEECVYGNPTRPDDVDVQDWWKPIRYRIARDKLGMSIWYVGDGLQDGYRCERHDRVFASHECCADCLEEDGEGEDEGQSVNPDPGTQSE